MLVAERYLGHRDDEAVASRLAATDPLRVVLSDVDRRRSRVRTETVGGTDVGIVVARELGDGDVLETDDGALVVVELAAVDALVIDFDDADVSATAALAVGHAAGNRHWDLAVRGSEALFPVPDSRERMRSAIGGDLPPGVTTRFESVPPTTFDDGHVPDHGHGEGGHAHDHGGDGDEHTHDHEHGEDARRHDYAHSHANIPDREHPTTEDGTDG
jgi:urease accessory protein